MKNILSSTWTTCILNITRQDLGFGPLKIVARHVDVVPISFSQLHISQSASTMEITNVGLKDFQFDLGTQHAVTHISNNSTIQTSPYTKYVFIQVDFSHFDFLTFTSIKMLFYQLCRAKKIPQFSIFSGIWFVRNMTVAQIQEMTLTGTYTVCFPSLARDTLTRITFSRAGIIFQYNPDLQTFVSW